MNAAPKATCPRVRGEVRRLAMAGIVPLPSMLSRRHLVLGLLGVSACKRSEPEATPPAPPASPRTRSYAGVEMIEVFQGGALETSPLVVAIHGRGDRPENWVEDIRTFPGKAQIVIPRAFEPYGDGFSWFPLREGMTDETLGAAVGASEARLWNGILAVARGRKVIVTGFSQGGILSFAMASRHPDVVTHAFPCAGGCPGPLLPKNKAKAAPILAFHGTEDRVLQIQFAREAVHAFQEQGNEAQLKEYPGLGHSMNAAMHQDLFAALVKALPPG